MEEMILNIITHSGEARTYAMEAIQYAKRVSLIKLKNL
ncbi:PTS system cellobiose-specific transporter subunit IIA [Clostridium botulinum CFSAN002369]|nr:PTS system cellobiose-specific transporter subunit IIA [Clostridium botulinum CFSAN002369]